MTISLSRNKFRNKFQITQKNNKTILFTQVKVKEYKEDSRVKIK